MVRVRRGHRAATVIMFPTWRSLARVSYPMWAMGLGIVVLVVLHHVLDTTSPSRGLAIRDSLIAAAAKTKSLPATETGDDVRSALAAYFRNFDAVIDASRFPAAVDVTLRDLDGVTCLEAEDVARRIEGSVVVQLKEPDSAAGCGHKNAMTWRLMP